MKPSYRFSEFNKDWKLKSLAEVIDIINIKNKSNLDLPILTNSARRGIIKQLDYFEIIRNSSKNLSNLKVVEKNDFVYNPRISKYAKFGPINISQYNGLVSPVYKVFRAKNIDPRFLFYFFSSSKWYQQLFFYGNTGARDDRFNINDKDFLSMKIFIPEKEEQIEIVNFLELINEKINLNNKLLNNIYELEKSVYRELFTDIDTNNLVKLDDLIEYEQPSKYIVNTVNFDEESDIPVLTPGKTLIKGFTNEKNNVFTKIPIILFDDFNTSMQFIDFPFKVESSAVKILKSKNNKYNLRVLYELMKNLNFVPIEHKRHWIDEFSKLKISIPSDKVLKKAENFNKIVSKRISKQLEIEKKLSELKNSLLESMFLNYER